MHMNQHKAKDVQGTGPEPGRARSHPGLEVHTGASVFTQTPRDVRDPELPIFFNLLAAATAM